MRNNRLSQEHIGPLAKFIMNNDDPSRHILRMSLDGCGLRDEDFEIILEGIYKSEHFEPSVQILEYKNNQMGMKSVDKLVTLIDNNSSVASLK